MPDDASVFEDPDADTDADEWVDVRMTNPEEEEWDVDIVVVNGQVEYVDLRVRPELLAPFLDCLVNDISDDRAHDILTTLAERYGVDIDPPDADE